MQFQRRVFIPVIGHWSSSAIANRIHPEVLIEFNFHDAGGVIRGEVNFCLRVHHLANRIQGSVNFVVGRAESSCGSSLDGRHGPAGALRLPRRLGKSMIARPASPVRNKRSRSFSMSLRCLSLEDRPLDN